MIGCALFDHPGVGAGPGYGCMQGGKPFRFSSMDELDRDICWVTNLPSFLFSDHNIHKKKWLRSSDYFGTPVQTIGEEIGYFDLRSLEAAKSLVTIFARVINLTERYVGSIREVDQHQGVDASLHEVIDAFISGRNKSQNRVPHDVHEGVSQCFAYPLPPSGETANNDILIRLPLHRVSHMVNVVETPMPSGSWSQVDLKGVDDPLLWIANHDKPILAQVSLLKPNQLIASLMPKKTPKSNRVWVAHPELIALNHFMNCRVEKVYMAENYGTTAQSLRLPPPTFTPQDYGSISSGLFAESYLLAACSGSSRLFSNVLRAAWLTSLARSLVLGEIARLIVNRFNVVGYGTSYVLVSVARNQVNRLREYIIRSDSLMLPGRYGSR